MLCSCLIWFKISLISKWFVKVVLPIKLYTVKTLVTHHIFVLSLTHADYESFPLLNFRIIRFLDNFENSLPEKRYSEICISTKSFSKSLLSFFSFISKWFKSNFQQHINKFKILASNFYFKLNILINIIPNNFISLFFIKSNINKWKLSSFQ